SSRIRRCAGPAWRCWSTAVVASSTRRGPSSSGSSIARVEILGSGQATPDTVVETGDFVRPQFRDGELILITTPAAGGTLVPFETRTPTPCCADH
ncbi:hypothetical protein AB0C31_32115, partial [Actinoplanes philippinensis]